jgi:DeoR family transcriptional regulator of aga operon
MKPRKEKEDDVFLSLVRLDGDIEVAELSADMERRYLKMAGTRADTPPSKGASAPPERTDAAKAAIATKAAGIIRDGQTIVIGSGTTTFALAQVLVDRADLTVVTNALDIARALQDRDGIEVIVLGGSLRPGMHSLLGHLTEVGAQTMHAETLFMGIPAVSIEQGLMSDHTPEVLTDRALRRMAGHVVLLADSTKFRRTGPAYVFGLEEINTVVTDEGIEDDVASSLEGHGITVLIAETT